MGGEETRGGDGKGTGPQNSTVAFCTPPFACFYLSSHASKVAPAAGRSREGYTHYSSWLDLARNRNTPFNYTRREGFELRVEDILLLIISYSSHQWKAGRKKEGILVISCLGIGIPEPQSFPVVRYAVTSVPLYHWPSHKYHRNLTKRFRDSSRQFSDRRDHQAVSCIKWEMHSSPRLSHHNQHVKRIRRCTLISPHNAIDVPHQSLRRSCRYS
ncbi:uncharacterized protein EI90DRAFT_1322601 [Cantharellus anzutake]|uniref:uncharacterized protein n=1 Tax=Cantharellus anzutake TaxID=1750568 RepID=UPI0019082601|nr:uncharacterized protein EI90DRAFT_1322601 [Cantharellus anzutake]KAF8342265.1 hypothetical protein EI90DRAFT_1322601 [Cantharellus anzutake]